MSERLFTDQAAVADSNSVLISATERTFFFWGTFNSARVEIEVEVASSVWVNYATISGPSAVIVDADVDTPTRVSIKTINSTSPPEINVQFGVYTNN